MLTTAPASAAGEPSAGERLSAPEPWRSSVWRALKAAVLGGAGFYSMMRLIDGNATITAAAFMGAFSAAMSLSVGRKGSVIPSAPAVIMGGAVIGAGVLAGIAAAVTGQGIDEALVFAPMGAFLGGVMLWMGLRSRRAERTLAAGREAAGVAPVLVTRDELAARVEEARRVTEADTHRLMRRLGVGGAVVVGFLLFPYERVFGAEPPELLAAGAFFGMWGAFGLLARSASRRGREVAERFGLICSACDKPYFGAFANLRLQKHLAEIGRCPNCGVRIVTED